jgi:hypothetical protein
MKDKVSEALDKVRPMLQNDGGDVELVSVEVSMRFLARLTSRDEGDTIQNIPHRHLG